MSKVKYEVWERRDKWFITEHTKLGDRAVRKTTEINLYAARKLWEHIQDTFGVPQFPHLNKPKMIQPKHKWTLDHFRPVCVKMFDLGVTPEAFNGKARSKYFEFYLFPMRLLAAQKKIRFNDVSWRLK